MYTFETMVTVILLSNIVVLVIGKIIVITRIRID